MRITIVIACLNAAPTIERCLVSIEIQDHDDVEILIADGGSKDATAQIVQKFSARSRKRILMNSAPDSGIADAWNKMMPNATGLWVLFLGADDCLAGPTALSQMIPHLETALPVHRIVYGKVALVHANGEQAEVVDRPWSPGEFRGCRTNLPHQSIFHHSSLFRNNGPFDTGLRIVSDYDFLLRELMLHEPLYVANVIVAKMQLGGLSTHRGEITAVIAEEMRLYKRHVGGISAILLWRYLKSLVIRLLFNIGGDRFALLLTNRYRRLVGRRPPLAY